MGCYRSFPAAAVAAACEKYVVEYSAILERTAGWASGTPEAMALKDDWKYISKVFSLATAPVQNASAEIQLDERAASLLQAYF